MKFKVLKCAEFHAAHARINKKFIRRDLESSPPPQLTTFLSSSSLKGRKKFFPKNFIIIFMQFCRAKNSLSDEPSLNLVRQLPPELCPRKVSPKISKLRKDA